MNPSQNFNTLYTDISNNVAAAIAEISDLNVAHQDGKKELSKIIERLGSIQSRFNGELKLLEQHSEWDKFTIAFFGETNAGKSTVIESMRIIFKEESREQLLQQNSQDLIKYQQALAEHVQQIRIGLNTVYAEYSAEIVAIKGGAAQLSRVLQEEFASKIKRKLWVAALGGFFVGGLLSGAIALLMRH